jgi:hypothetical protein
MLLADLAIADVRRVPVIQGVSGDVECRSSDTDEEELNTTRPEEEEFEHDGGRPLRQRRLPSRYAGFKMG